MDISAYLERIDYRGSLDITPETLRDLQVAHLRTVPFENLSVVMGEPVILDDASLFEKIVVRRRGGFCYELNGLFAALLRDLGFPVEMLSAGVWRSSAQVFGPGFDHLALMVTLEHRWLVDVGFGGSFFEPLRLDDRAVYSHGRCAHRLDADEERLTLLERNEKEEWKACYRFDLTTHQFADYAEGCRFHQTSPDSPFTRGPFCILPDSEGRIWLHQMRLYTTRHGEQEERELADAQEYAEALRTHFGIVVPEVRLLIPSSDVAATQRKAP